MKIYATYYYFENDEERGITIPVKSTNPNDFVLPRHDIHKIVVGERETRIIKGSRLLVSAPNPKTSTTYYVSEIDRQKYRSYVDGEIKSLKPSMLTYNDDEGEQ